MIECIQYRPQNKGNFLGFATIFVPSWGVELYGFTLFQKDGKRWVNMPSKDYVDKEGNKKFSQFMKFRDPVHKSAFCIQVKDAIDFWCKTNNVHQTQAVQMSLTPVSGPATGESWLPQVPPEYNPDNVPF